MKNFIIIVLIIHTIWYAAWIRNSALIEPYCAISAPSEMIIDKQVDWFSISYDSRSPNERRYIWQIYYYSEDIIGSYNYYSDTFNWALEKLHLQK